MKINMDIMPAGGRKILQKLENAGYESYFAGGCVRDALSNQKPYDVDIATAAQPGEVCALFARTIPTGTRHGTVTVLYGRAKAEVTTFRSEGAYSDRRRPDSVCFCTGAAQDAKRRDFTINAMFCASDGTLIDYAGGEEDLQKGIIRTVGDPEERFGEDALRMIRAFRFAAKTGFTIEENTLRAIKKLSGLCNVLSHERVRQELDRTLATKRPEKVSDMLEYGLLDRYAHTGSLTEQDREALRRAKPGTERWAVLCILLLRAGRIRSAESFLRMLRCDRHTIILCKAAQAAALHGMPQSRKDIKLYMHEYGVSAVSAACPIYGQRECARIRRTINEIVRSGECYTLAGLAVNGQILENERIASGRELGRVLDLLVRHCMAHPEDNETETLLLQARAMRDLASDGKNT